MKKPFLQTIVLAVCGFAGAFFGAVRTTDVPGTDPGAPGVGSARRTHVCDQDLDIRTNARATHGHWHLPGVRNLEPSIFGTVANPLGFEFGIGVPLYDRLDDGNGSWTTTALPGADGNECVHLTTSSISLEVRDRSPVDQQTYAGVTFDEVHVRANMIDPWGRTIDIRCDQALPRGPYSTFWGGVGSNVMVHGATGLGLKTLPQAFAYVTCYGRGEVRINGQLLPGNDNRLVHCMVVHGVHDDLNNPGPAGGIGPFIGTNAEVNPDDLEVHLSLPATRFIPNPVANSPIAGVGDFIHVTFDDVTLSGSTINGTLTR